MSLSEFDFIRRYFWHAFEDGPEVLRGIGDDAAIVTVPDGMYLALSMDTLVAGTHFPHSTSPEDIGYKSLAVNLSDMAAMGAVPRWFTLALTLPEGNEDWVKSFMQGLAPLAKQYSLSLIGGDLTRGPLTITIQIHGLLPEGKGLYRDGAQTDDLIYVSGTLGDAGLALDFLAGRRNTEKKYQEYLLNRLNRPMPGIELGIALRDIANSAIDISDGLLADLEHIVTASGKGAVIQLDELPLSAALSQLPLNQALDLALTAGDDYELCFTVPKNKQQDIEDRLRKYYALTCIGTITGGAGIQCLDSDGTVYQPAGKGYQHF